MDITAGETWRFSTCAGPVDRVYLAIDGPTTACRWIEMQPDTRRFGSWSVLTNVAPGRHRMRYFTVDKGTTLNCGAIGLFGERVSAPDAQVLIDDLTSLAASA